MVNFLTGFLTGALQSGVKAQEAKKEADLKRAERLEERRAALELYGMKYSMEQATKQAQRQARADMYKQMGDFRAAEMALAGVSDSGIGTYRQGLGSMLDIEGKSSTINYQNQISQQTDPSLPLQPNPYEGRTGLMLGNPTSTMQPPLMGSGGQPSQMPPQQAAPVEPIQVQDLVGGSQQQSPGQATGVNFQENPQWQAADQELAQISQRVNTGQFTPQDQARMEELYALQSQLEQGMQGAPQPMDPGQGDTMSTTQPEAPVNLSPRDRIKQIEAERSDLARKAKAVSFMDKNPYMEQDKVLEQEYTKLNKEIEQQKANDLAVLKQESKTNPDIEKAYEAAKRIKEVSSRIKNNLPGRGLLNPLDQASEAITGSKGILEDDSSDVKQLFAESEVLKLGNLPVGSISNYEGQVASGTMPGIDDTYEGRLNKADILIHSQRRWLQRDVFLNKFVSEGGSLADGKKAWQQYQEDYPLIPPGSAKDAKSLRQVIEANLPRSEKATPDSYFNYRPGDEQIISQGGQRVPQGAINKLREDGDIPEIVDAFVQKYGQEAAAKILQGK